MADKAVCGHLAPDFFTETCSQLSHDLTLAIIVHNAQIPSEPGVQRYSKGTISTVVAFVSAEDSSGESVFLAEECLDLEGLFADFGVAPELVDPGVDAAGSLEAASEVLAAARPVPLALWAMSGQALSISFGSEGFR